MVSTLPKKIKDASDFFKTGKESAKSYEKKVLNKALSWKEWYGQQLLRDYDGTPASFSKVAELLSDFLSLLKSTDRSFFSYYFSKSLSTKYVIK